jgi:hypothetical protein
MPIYLDPFTQIVNVCCEEPDGWPAGFPDESLFTGIATGVGGVRYDIQGGVNSRCNGTETDYTTVTDMSCTDNGNFQRSGVFALHNARSVFYPPPYQQTSETLTTSWATPYAQGGTFPYFTFTSSGSSVPYWNNSAGDYEVWSWNYGLTRRPCDGRYQGSGFGRQEQVIDLNNANLPAIMALLSIPVSGSTTYGNTRCWWVFDAALSPDALTGRPFGYNGQFGIRYRAYYETI